MITYIPVDTDYFRVYDNKLDIRIESRRAPFLVGSLITFVRLNSEIISNNLLLFLRSKSTFKSPFMYDYV